MTEDQLRAGVSNFGLRSISRTNKAPARGAEEGPEISGGLKITPFIDNLRRASGTSLDGQNI